MFRRMEILQYFKVVPQYCTWVTFHHCIFPDAGFYPLCHYIHITDVLFIKHHRHHLVDIWWECSHPCTTVVIHLINSILIFDFLSLRSFKIWRFRYLWGCSLKTSQYYFYPTVCWPTFYCIKRQNKKNKKQMRMFSVHHLVKFRISWCHFSETSCRCHPSNMLWKIFKESWTTEIVHRKPEREILLSPVPHLYPPTFPSVHQPSPLELKVLSFRLYSPHWETCLCWLIAVWSLLLLLPANFSLPGFLQPTAAWVWGFLAVIVRYLLLIG